VGTGNLDNPLLYPEQVRVQLAQMGDLGVPCPLPTTGSTASASRPKMPSPLFPLPTRAMLKTLFKTPEQMDQEYNQSVVAFLTGAYGPPAKGRTNP
jgi:hypothetical protein